MRPEVLKPSAPYSHVILSKQGQDRGSYRPSLTSRVTNPVAPIQAPAPYSQATSPGPIVQGTATPSSTDINLAQFKQRQQDQGSFWNRSRPYLQAAWEASPFGIGYNRLTGNQAAAQRGQEDLGGYFTENLPDAARAGVNSFLMTDLLERDPRMAADPYQNWAGRSLAAGGHALLAAATAGQGNAAMASNAGRAGASRFLTQGMPALASKSSPLAARAGSQILQTGVNMGVSPVNPLPMWNMTQVMRGAPVTATGLLNPAVRAMGIGATARGLQAGVESPYMYLQDNPEAGIGRLALEAAKGPLAEAGFVPLPLGGGLAGVAEEVGNVLTGESARRDDWTNMLYAHRLKNPIEDPRTGLQRLATPEEIQRTRQAVAAEASRATRRENPVSWAASRIAGLPAYANYLTGSRLLGSPYSSPGARGTALLGREIDQINDQYLGEQLEAMREQGIPLTEAQRATESEIQDRRRRAEQDAFIQSLRGGG